MQSHHIIAGFSDIKSEIRTKYQPDLEQSRLKLWFTFEHDVLYAHDFSNHKKFVALAIYNTKSGKYPNASIGNEWRILFTQRYYGKKLIEYVVALNEPPDFILENLRNLYKSNGFIPL